LQRVSTSRREQLWEVIVLDWELDQKDQYEFSFKELFKQFINGELFT
jgi:hypothetical protein